MDDYRIFTDEEIISDGISETDSDKIRELISRYTELIFQLVRGYENAADHEELVSEAYSALLRAILTYKQAEAAKFSTYASVCINNSLKNLAVKSARRNARFVGLPDEELDLVAAQTPSMEELMILREQADDVSYHITHSLTELEKRCINGVILGMSYDDMAKQLDIDKKSVDNAVARARAKLKKLCGI